MRNSEIRIVHRPFLSTRAIYEGLVFACAAGGAVYLVFKALGA
jgi:hypothetical protein